MVEMTNAAALHGGRVALRLRRGLRPGAAVCLIWVMSLWLSVPAADAKVKSWLPDDYQIKAEFIYNFAQFIEWPGRAFASPEAPFVIAILGDDPFGHSLEQAIGDKTVGGRPVRVRRLGAGQSLSGCHLLFVSASEHGRWHDIRQRLKDASVLTVGDMERFAARGGMIGFVVDGTKVGFEVNIESAERAGLKFSSRLLSLARAVKRGMVSD